MYCFIATIDHFDLVFIEQSVKEEVDVCNIATCSRSSSKYFIAIAFNSFCQIEQGGKVEATKFDSQSQIRTETVTSCQFLTEKHLA